MSERASSDAWDAMLMFDVGDTFVPTYHLPEHRRADAVATAEFIVGELNRAGLAAMTLGDRDLALGRKALEALAKRAEFPIVAANLVDSATRAPIFDPGVIVEAGGVKVGVIGLMSAAAALRVLKPTAGAQADLLVTDPAAAAAATAAELTAKGAQLLVALSHLGEPEQAQVAAAVPKLRLFLGGQSASARGETRAVGDAVAVGGGQKGKYVAITPLHLLAANGAGGALVDREAKARAERRLERAERRVRRLEERLAKAKAPKTKGAEPPDAGASSQRPARRSPAEMTQRQLASARAQFEAVRRELEGLPAVDGSANWVAHEMVPLSKKVADDAEVKAAVDAFLAAHPSASPASRARPRGRAAPKAPGSRPRQIKRRPPGTRRPPATGR